jgi:excisionase family DNA binding protein
MNNNLLNIKEASEYLNTSKETLRNWDKSGKLPSIKTVGGHRRYQKEKLDEFIGIIKSDETSDVVATYARVSSHEQKTKGDLDRQSQRISEYCAKKKYSVEHIIKDVGSGLSDTRVGFVKLVDLVIKKKISKIVIENKDRLTRFQYNLIKTFFNSYDVELECVDNNNISNEEEFVNDIMMLMASFSGKLYGKRSVKRKKELKEEKLKLQQLKEKNEQPLV